MAATADYFKVYGIQPVLGRTFLPEEDAVGRPRGGPEQSFWQRIFGGARDVIGRPLQLNGETYTVIGVAPPEFGQASKVDLWAPIAFAPDERDNKNRGAHYVSVVGRLKPA